MRTITIGITDCGRYMNYEQWILNAPTKVDVICLSHHTNNVDDIERCHGIVLSGGEDIHPSRYKRSDLLDKLQITDIDEKRDEFEWTIIERALALKLPMLGICRGLQLFNVYQGGTLIHDIPTVIDIHGHARFGGPDEQHDIRVEENSLLHGITGCKSGAVNSSHHQCIEKLGENLKVSARAEHPIIEAIEWQNTSEYSFYLGVQWHPERMVDQTSPFSYKIRQAFLDYIIQHEQATGCDADRFIQS